VIRLERVEAAPRSGGRRVLGPLDFAVEPGERHLILGGNGAGKTTLLRLLAGLTSPLAGRARWGTDEAAPGADPPRLWPRVAALFETPDPQFLTESVAAEVSFGLESVGLSSAEVASRVAETLDAFGIRSFASRDPRTLSAGEKARALLAAACAARPECLLLDQTLAHLDPGTRRALEARLAREASGHDGGAAAAAGRARPFALVRTHQEAEPAFDGERLHILDAGLFCDAGSLGPEAVLAAPHLPLSLALRVSSVLAARGAWEGGPVGEVGSLVRALSVATAGAVGRGGAAPTVGGAAAGTGRGRSGGLGPDSPRTGATAFALQSLRWGPDPGRPLFDVLDLEGARGEIVALVGRSGSGKSSLLRLLAGLETPQGGVAWRAEPRDGGRLAAALALEYPERQLIGRSVLEDVALTLWVNGMPRVEREKLAFRALAAVGMTPGRFAARVPSTLSEGEKRRVALAGLLAEPAPLLLFDEPTAGLDPDGRRALRATLASLRARARTVVIASHDLDFVHAVADRVVLLAREEGTPSRIVRDGAPADVFRDEAALRDAGIPAPDVVIVEDALRAAGCFAGEDGRARDADDLVERLARTADATAAAVWRSRNEGAVVAARADRTISDVGAGAA
jgi:energy-coupling factor transport system ATP-binding protein